MFGSKAPKKRDDDEQDDDDAERLPSARHPQRRAAPDCRHFVRVAAIEQPAPLAAHARRATQRRAAGYAAEDGEHQFERPLVEKPAAAAARRAARRTRAMRTGEARARVARVIASLARTARGALPLERQRDAQA